MYKAATIETRVLGENTTQEIVFRTFAIVGQPVEIEFAGQKIRVPRTSLALAVETVTEDP